MKPLPLLCQNVEVYNGPFIPTTGLRGQVSASGLDGVDVLNIIGVRPDMSTQELGKLYPGVAGLIFDSKTFVYVRAERLVSSGKPIDVWAD